MRDGARGRSSWRTVGLGLAAATALVFCAPAAGQQAQITQRVFTDEGLPYLVGNPVPDGSKGTVIAWRECRPGVPCRALAAEGRGDFIEPGDVPAGTTFEMDALSDSGVLTTDRSIPWQGRVASTSSPGVSGALRVGRIVLPRAASWTGGWEGDYDRFNLEACRTAAGLSCEALAAQGEDPLVCPGGGAVLGHRYLGWWVRAVDGRLARDSVFAGVGYSQPRDIPLPAASATVVRSGLVGPVRASRGAFAECGKPRVQIFKNRIGEARRPTFAAVGCTSTCDVVLVVRDARRTIRRRVDVETNGLVGLRLHRRLSGKSVRVRVIVNGHQRARRVVLLKPARAPLQTRPPAP